MNFLTHNKMAVVEGAATAAQTALTSDIVDMKDFGGVVFTALLGDVSDGCVLTLNVEHGDEEGGGDMADTTLSATFTAGASDADSKLLTVEHYHPLKRYARAVLTRTTANAVVGGIIAIQFEPREVPVTQDATNIDHEFAVGAPSAA